MNFVDADVAGGAELVRTSDGSLILMTELSATAWRDTHPMDSQTLIGE